jgi:hypothetical protein
MLADFAMFAMLYTCGLVGLIYLMARLEPPRASHGARVGCRLSGM